VGLTCGFAVFSHEQARGEAQYLGALRIAPRRFWYVKVGFWALTASAALVLMYVECYLVMEWRQPFDSQGDRHLFGPAINNTFLNLDFDLPLFLSWWPVHGYCFGILFGLLMGRPVVGVLFGAFACLITLALWLPSFVCGGVPVWLLFATPVLCLFASRRAMWAWMG